jgi:hypothetical protein
MSDNRQRTSVIILVFIFISVGLVGHIFGVLDELKARSVREAGFMASRALELQMHSLRTFYTKEVVSRAHASGMMVNYDFEKSDNTLPLPATLIHHLGAKFAEDIPGATIRLYSNYPFPHRADQKYDTFEQEALKQVTAYPDKSFVRMEEREGRLVVRLANADPMRKACVNCHNTHPESPKTNWKVGDVRGVLEVTLPVDQLDYNLEQSHRDAKMALGLLALCFLAGLVIVRRK